MQEALSQVSLRRGRLGRWAPGSGQFQAEPKVCFKEAARVWRWLQAKRDLIETVVDMLADQFMLESTRACSLWGVNDSPRCEAVGFHRSIELNRQLGRSPIGYQRTLSPIAPLVLED